MHWDGIARREAPGLGHAAQSVDGLRWMLSGKNTLAVTEDGSYVVLLVAGQEGDICLPDSGLLAGQGTPSSGVPDAKDRYTHPGLGIRVGRGRRTVRSDGMRPQVSEAAEAVLRFAPNGCWALEVLRTLMALEG